MLKKAMGKESFVLWHKEGGGAIIIIIIIVQYLDPRF
jgi:hypothetical protein